MKRQLLLCALCAVSFTCLTAQNKLFVTSSTGGEDIVGSLPNVVKAAPNGATIEINISEDQITITEEIAIAKNLTIDGKGKTISVANPGVSPHRIFKLGNNVGISNAHEIVIKNCTLWGGLAASDGRLDSLPTYSATIWIAPTTKFTGENITFDKGKGGYAGAFLNGGNAELTNCTFLNAEVVSIGGAVYNQKQNLTLTKCTFRNNKTTNSGGAIAANQGGVVKIIGCHFESNSSNLHGGAVYVKDKNTYVEIEGTTFVNNTTSATGYGGAIYIFYDSKVPANAVKGVKITNCKFENNTAEKGAGAICCYSGSLEIDKSSFIENKGNSDSGGAITIYDLNKGNFPTCTLSNSYFEGNSSTSNGGAIFSKCENTITNTTFYNNSAKVGGAITTTTSPLKIFNCSFVGNKSKTYAGGIHYNSPNLTNTTYNSLFFRNTTENPESPTGFEDRDIFLYKGILIGSNNIYTNFFAETINTVSDQFKNNIKYTDQQLFANINEATKLPIAETTIEGTTKYFMIAANGIADGAGTAVEGVPTKDQRGIDRNKTNPSIGAIEVEKTSAEKKEIIDSEVLVFPCPAQGTLYLRNNQAKQVIVSNTAGCMVININFPGQSIDISSLPSGIYTISIVSDTVQKTSFIVLN